MLSVDFIRKNKKRVAQAAKNKNRHVEIDRILNLDEQRKEIIQKEQKLREKRNKTSHQKPTLGAIKEGRRIKEKLKEISQKLKKIEEELNTLLSFVPNVYLDNVPIGKDEKDNVVIKKWKEPKQFSFEPKSHIELGRKLNIFDLKRGTKVSGFRGYFLKNEGAILQFAILFYVFKKLIVKGYAPMIAPAIVKGFTLFGSGQFPWGEKEVYKLNDNDAYLAGTAEVPITSFYANETLKEESLPKKFVAFSPCFRKEAGAYGKDTKGLYRVHEFWKIEQVIIARNNLEEGLKLHQELQENTEEILKDFGIPYRVILMCTGDMGEPQMKKYDTEVWMPAKKKYGEIASNSIMGDFQTRRLKIKYRTEKGETKYCYSLNDTAIPSPRILITILENYQQEDGSILIPKVLQPFTGFKKISPKS